MYYIVAAFILAVIAVAYLQIPGWIVLIGAGIAALVGFGWIVSQFTIWR